MTGDRPLTIRTPVAILGVAALLLIGSGATYLFMRVPGRSDRVAPAEPAVAAGAVAREPGAGSAPTTKERLSDVVVPISKEAAERAGIVVTPVSSGTPGGSLRLPGLVEPNAYRQVDVTSLVAGRVTRVAVALGDRLRRGQVIADVYSPELSEAQTRYLSSRAKLEAHERELQRTEKLVNIGAASRRELEQIHAEHAAELAEVDSARSRLELLGVSPASLDSLAPGARPSATTNVPAPIDGVVTERAANVGLNVDPSMKLFTVVDLSTVWIVSDLYERDFSRIRIGSEAVVTTAAYPEQALRGRVSYIDPQVNPATRTAKLRVELPNPRGELRLGMYADVRVSAGSGGAALLMIPRSAVQTVGDRSVVYLVDPKEAGRFIEREVHVGQPSGDRVEVLSGLRPGDVVVSEGSFFVRAERERLGLRQAGGAASGTSTRAGMADMTNAKSQPSSDVQTAQVIVSEKGFEPSTLTLRAGIPARVTFKRITDKTCATEVVFPSLNIKRSLPLNETVAIRFTPTSREIAFVCGMNMFRGTVVAQ